MAEFPAVRHLGLGGEVLGVFSHGGILEQQHAAAAGGDGLVAVEAEGADLGKGAGVLPFIEAADALGGVFHHLNLPFPADVHDFPDAHGMAESVHGHAGFYAATGAAVVAAVGAQFGVGLQPRLHGVGRKAQGTLVHIQEYGMCADIADGVAGGDEGEGLGEDFVVPLNPGQHQGHVQGVGSAHAHHGAGGAGIGGNLFLETVHEGAHAGNEGGVYALLQVFFLISGELRDTQGNKLLCAVQFMYEIGNFLVLHLTSFDPGSSPFPHVRS